MADAADDTGKLIAALSDLLVTYLQEMEEDGVHSGLINDDNQDEARAYIAALLIRGGVKSLAEMDMSGRVMAIVAHVVGQSDPRPRLH